MCVEILAKLTPPTDGSRGRFRPCLHPKHFCSWLLDTKIHRLTNALPAHVLPVTHVAFAAVAGRCGNTAAVQAQVGEMLAHVDRGLVQLAWAQTKTQRSFLSVEHVSQSVENPATSTHWVESFGHRCRCCRFRWCDRRRKCSRRRSRSARALCRNLRCSGRRCHHGWCRRCQCRKEASGCTVACIHLEINKTHCF